MDILQFIFFICVLNAEGSCKTITEVMACTGGCLGGSATINAYRPALKQLSGFVKESPAIKDVIDKMFPGKSSSNIRMHLIGRYKSAFGYHFKYIEE